MITYKQLTLAEIFEDCQNKFDNDKYQFLSLLDEAINLDEIVPVSFVSHFPSDNRTRIEPEQKQRDRKCPVFKAFQSLNVPNCHRAISFILFRGKVFILQST